MGKYCCASLEGLINNFGKKGASLESTDSKDAPYKIVFRLIDQDQEANFINEVRNKRIQVDHVLFGGIRIKYCPWCGLKLSELKFS